MNISTRRRGNWFAAVAAVWVAAPAVGQGEVSMTDSVFSPRVVGERRPDFHSLEAVLASPHFAGRKGEALAMAIYDYFTSTTDGIWHGWPMNEREGDPVGWGDVSDPVKLLNAYGWTICGQSAGMLQGIYRAAGMPSRIRSLPGHNVCEVFYDDRWHVLDVDMWTWFRTPQGHIAGVDELADNARALIIDNPARSNPCDLPDRALDDYVKMYDKAKGGAEIFPFWASRTHTMDFVLRPGETLIRSQAHEGRFHLPASWKELLDSPVRREWEGLPRERFAPFRTIGNGRWIYAPDLTSRTRDVELGAWSREGLTQDGRGLAGPGILVFRIQSPYPFCGIPDATRLGFPASNGVWLAISGEGVVRSEVTDSEGRFVKVAETGGVFDVKSDLTQLMRARYETLIRLTLADGARLDRLMFDGHLLTAPQSLPRLAEGRNRMELRTRDKFHKRTTPWTVPVDFRSEPRLRAALVRVNSGTLVPWKRDRLCIAPPADGSAQAVFRFEAPAGRSFAWAYAIATVPEGPAGAPARRASLEWSVDGAAWSRGAEIAIPNTPLQWDGSMDAETVFPKAARSVWIRVTSATGVIALEFAGHIEEQPLPAALRIVHRWREGDAGRAFEAPAGKSVYEIICGPAPALHTIEMTAPSATGGS